MRKGISPIIAATLLIAFTMSIALLTGPFLTDLTTNAQEGQNEQANTLVDASSTSFEIDEIVYDTGSGNYTITVRNTGSQPVNGFSTTLQGETPIQKTFSETLGPGEITRFQISTDKNLEYDSLQIDDTEKPVSASASLTEIKQGEAPSSPSGLTVSNS